MGFFNNVKARFKGNDDRRYEEEFERAFREGNWPEGVDDFEPLANTGAFLPQTYDVDPLADETLPGNARRAAAPYDQYAPYDAYDPADEPLDPNLEAQGSVAAVYAQPPAQSPFSVIGGGAPRPRASESVVRQASAMIDRQENSPFFDQEPVDGPVEAEADEDSARPRGARPSRREEAPEPDDGVHVFARSGDTRVPRPAPTPHAAPRPFADRLRERVAAAANSVARPLQEDFRSRPAAYGERRDDARRPVEREYERGYDAEPYERRQPRRTVMQEHDAAEFDGRASRGADERRERPRERARMQAEREPYERPLRDEAPVERAPRVRGTEERRGYDEAPERLAPRSEGRAPAAPVAPKPVPVSCVVLRPRNYDAVSEIAQGVIGEKRPTVLVLRGCNNELIRRVLDFSFGLCCASGAGMREFGDRVYAILPKNTTLTDEDMVAMRRQGILKG